MNIVIERAVTGRSKAREHAWLYGLNTRPWPAFALLALVGAIGAVVLETRIAHTGEGTRIPIGGVFSLLLLLVTIGAVVSVSRHWRGVKHSLYQTPDHTVTTFVELDDAGISYGIRDLWRSDLSWASYRSYSVTERDIAMLFVGIQIRVPKEHLTQTDLKEITECLAEKESNHALHVTAPPRRRPPREGRACS